MSEGGLREVDSVEVTCLVDNLVDFLLMGTETVRRPRPRGDSHPADDAPFMAPGRLNKMLRAEHGFSALISFRRGQQRHSLLLDAGASLDGLAHNMNVLGLDASTIEAIVLSHGHYDHVAGLGWLAAETAGRGVPVFAHPDAWCRRRIAIPGREPAEIPAAERDALAGAGFDMRESRRPTALFDGDVLISGEVERTTAFETGFALHETLRDDEWVPDPLILDDQAVILNIRGKGLAVVTGCGHAGIINILRHAVKLTGIERVYAVIGGFHLHGPQIDAVIAATVDAMLSFRPQVVVPAHCTGLKAFQALAAAMPEALAQNSAGTTYLL